MNNTVLVPLLCKVFARSHCGFHFQSYVFCFSHAADIYIGILRWACINSFGIPIDWVDQRRLILNYSFCICFSPCNLYCWNHSLFVNICTELFLIPTISFSTGFTQTNLCSLGEKDIHNESASEDAHYSSERNDSE